LVEACKFDRLFFLPVFQVEEGCAADEIAAAVNHVMCIIEAEATYGGAAAGPY
jgi:uncharacterized protein YggL (DUF469 family)